MLFDTHAHYDAEQFDSDRRQVLDALPGAGVSLALNPGCDLPSSRAAVALAEQYEFLYAAVGYHPENCAPYVPEDLEVLRELAGRPKVVAVGEIGLDYHYDFSPRDVQKQVFEAQLGLACDLGFPVVIHDREAHADTMELLKKYRPKGIVHCYSGSAEMAKEILKLGMYLGFGGAVTFKNARKTLEAAAAVPLDRLLVETDCPYMSPVPFRGQRCDSAMISHTAERLAELHGIPAQELLDRTCENAERVYRLTDVQR